MEALAQLRAAVDEARAKQEAWEAKARAKQAEWDAQIEKAAALVARLDKLTADAEEWRQRHQSGTREGVVTTSKRVRVSLRAVAEAVGVSHVLLSRARAGKRRIRKSIAEKIAAITPDLPATRKTWPLGWVDED
jgi:hypothetical protein